MYTFKDEQHLGSHRHGHEKREGQKGHVGADGRVHSHDSHLTSGFDIELLMVGEPGYQAHRCLAYYTKFNNHNATDEQATKILLNLPMVPHDQLRRVRLNYAAHCAKEAAVHSRTSSLALLATVSQTPQLSAHHGSARRADSSLR